MDIEKNIGPGARHGKAAVPQWAWKLSLAACAAIWGGSFVVMKDTLDNIPPARLMGIRFAASAVIVGALARLFPLSGPVSAYLAQQTEAIAHLDFHRALPLSAVTSWGTWLVFLALAVWVVKKSSGKRARYGV